MENRVSVLGIPFDNMSMEEAVEAVYAMRLEEKNHRIVTPNAEIVYLARTEEKLRGILQTSDFVAPDGIGVVYGAKLLKTPLKQKVAGIELGEHLLEKVSQSGEGVFFLGAKPGVAQTAANNLCAKYPGLNIVGVQDGYFQDVNAVIEQVNHSGAVVLFVCLGAPKQEYFMAEHQDEFTTVRIMLGLGGSLDGYAGTVKRAPKWMIRMGLEWLYRLLKEPSRIGRMMALPKFMLCVLKNRKKDVAK